MNILSPTRVRKITKAAVDFCFNPATDFGVLPTVFQPQERGQYRVQNQDAVGYLMYIGVNGPVNLGGTEDVFSATLPISVSWPLPGSDTITLQIVVRFRDSYGLLSQNSHPWLLTLTPAGSILLPIPAPQAMVAIPRLNTNIGVMGQYPTRLIEQNPADKIKIWVSTGIPDVSAVPNYFNLISVDPTATVFSINFGSFAAGTYNVTAAFFRSVDSALSPYVTTTVVIPAIPAAPTPVFTDHVTP